MPTAERTLDLARVRQVCAGCFTPSADDLVGLEAEWPVHRRDDVRERPRTEAMRALAATNLPSGGRVTFEPGGQVELSTPPATSLPSALRALGDDLAVLDRALAEVGLERAETALDGRRPPHRVVRGARYDAMADHFGALGPCGAEMMTNTASVQVNLSHHPDSAFRWSTLNRLGPVVLAVFANSPGLDHAGRRWASLRQAVWWATAPTRTAPVRTDVAPRRAWSEYVLAADVLLVRDGAGGGTGLPPGLAFGRWVREGHRLGWPTEDDLAYHLTTLFPPVRPRGWLEVRFLDALPDWIRTAAALVVATIADADAASELDDRLGGACWSWSTASRYALADAGLAAASTTLLDVVRRHLDSISDDPDHHAAVAELGERYTSRRRTPGDDLDPVDLRRRRG